jgi:hypothetical protein
MRWLSIWAIPMARGGQRSRNHRGDWSDAFSDDLDVDAELKEIRGEWQKEWRGNEFVG